MPSVLQLQFLLYLSPLVGAAALSATTAAFPPYRVLLNSVDHYVRDTGDPAVFSLSPPPIALLLHGLAGSTDSWEDVAPLLYSRGVRCIAVDRAGFGRTARPAPRRALPAPPVLPDFLREGAAAALEGAPFPRLPGAFGDILPGPARVLATAVRRPGLLVPRLPWALSGYPDNPYSGQSAVDALWPLLRHVAATSPTPAAGEPRRIYLVGHSAGGPLALRACDALATGRGALPSGCEMSGVALVAPAVLDPEEDPDVYDSDDEDTSPVWLRRALFRLGLFLPDAVGVPLARRIFDGRNITEALLNQTSPAAQLSAERTQYLAQKYLSPVEEFPEEWDVGLLNVYRADFLAAEKEGAPPTRGRSLLGSVREGVARTIGGQGCGRPTFCVVTGDDDRVVSARASRRVAELLGTENTMFVEMAGVGHLPMDEQPRELAEILLEFMGE